MLAIDTNVVVRYLAGDHPRQSAQARQIIDGEDVFVSLTVLLETGWVMGTLYGYAPDRIAPVLRAFAGLPHVTVANANQVLQALDWMQGGMDFADALHLAQAAGCEALISFDRGFARAAKRLGTVEVRAP